MARSTTASVASTTSTRNRAILLIAAVFGILSAALMFAFLNSRDSGESANDIITAGGAAESVVVITRDVGVGEEITADMVTTRSIPAAALLDGRVDDVEDVVGKVATSPIYAGEQVITAKVTTYSGQNTLAYKIPDNMRAVSLEVSHEAWVVAGLIQPGDRVDIIGVTTLESVDPLTGEVRPDLVSGYLAQNVEVLAVAQSLIKFVPNLDQQASDAESDTAGAAIDPAQTAADPDEEVGTYEQSISVTLALPPDLASKITMIDAIKDEQGQWRLVARQKGDDTELSGQLTWSFDDLFVQN